MSYFTVFVVTDKPATEELVAEQLAPFHEFECTGRDDQYVQDIDRTADAREEYDKYHDGGLTFAAWAKDEYGYDDKFGRVECNAAGEVVKVIRRTNPNAKWDSWVIGGRWPNLLTLKDGKGSNSARKGDIDFEAMRQRSKAHELSIHRRVIEIVGSFDEFKTFQEVLKQNTDDDGNEDLEKARDEYHAQPQRQKVTEAIDADREATRDLIFLNIDDYAATEDEIARRAYMNGVRAFAFVRDQKWSEKGEMGWWGIVTDEKDDWGETLKNLLDDVPDDHWITVVGCHI